jgi:hypothetical protein
VRDGEKVALLRELLRRVQARADREHLVDEQPREAAASETADPWTPLNDDAVEALSGRLLGMQTIPPPKPDDSGLVERWTELLEQDTTLVSTLVPPEAAPSEEELVPLPSEPEPDPLPLSRSRTPPLAAGPESSKTAPPGYFETSVSAAVDALDEPSLLGSAETDLRVRRPARPSASRSRRLRSASPVEARRPPSVTTARVASAADDASEASSQLVREGPPASADGADDTRGRRAELPRSAAPPERPPEALAREVEAQRVSEPAAARARVLPEESTLELRVPVQRGAARWLVALAGVTLGVAGLSILARDRDPAQLDAPEVGEPARIAASSSASLHAGAPSPSRSTVTVARPVPSASASAPRQAAPPPLRDPTMFGWLRVETPTPGRVYVQGIDVGPTGVALEVRCGLRNVRVAQAEPPPPGSSFPAWHGESKSVVVPCGAEHHAGW